jgi:hypothetical protein
MQLLKLLLVAPISADAKQFQHDYIIAGRFHHVFYYTLLVSHHHGILWFLSSNEQIQTSGKMERKKKFLLVFPSFCLFREARSTICSFVVQIDFRFMLFSNPPFSPYQNSTMNQNMHIHLNIKPPSPHR